MLNNNYLLLLSILLMVSACAKEISGLAQGRERCLSYGYKPGTENYSKCIFEEDSRRLQKLKKEQSIQ